MILIKWISKQAHDNILVFFKIHKLQVSNNKLNILIRNIELFYANHKNFEFPFAPLLTIIICTTMHVDFVIHV